MMDAFHEPWPLAGPGEGEIRGDFRDESAAPALDAWARTLPADAEYLLIITDVRLDGLRFYTREGRLYVSPRSLQMVADWYERQGVDPEGLIMPLCGMN